MDVNPKLNDIDDCLYRVATRALIINHEKDKVLLIKEIEMWWGFPGGGVDHGEALEVSLAREVEEEIGVPASKVVSDFKIVHHTIGGIVNNIPRVNLFYRVTLPEKEIKKTDHVIEWQWFTKDEFMKLNINPSYRNLDKLAEIIFES